MASPSRQIGGFLFVTNSNNNNHLKLFLHSESRGNMKTLTLSLASHLLWCVVWASHCPPLHWRASHHTSYRWGAGLGRRGPEHGSILHNILNSGSITFLSQLKWAFYVFSQHWGEKTIKKLDWQFFDDNTAFVAFKLFTQFWGLGIEHEDHFTVLQ